MGSRKTYDGAENVYEAAELWVERALRTDDSLFTPGVPIWTSRWLGELRERFLDQPDEGSGGFYSKLSAQLEGSPPEVYQLMAEVLYVHFLSIWKTGMRGTTKQSRVEEVLGWGSPVRSIPEILISGLTPGIANFGPNRGRGFPYYVGFLIEFAEQLKERQPNGRQHLLADPWTLKEFATQIEFKGQLFLSGPYSHWPQLEALSHLAHPDAFEGIVSIEIKEAIAGAAAFAHFVTAQTDDVDRKIQQIRQGLEEKLGRDFDFYDQDVRSQWDPTFEHDLWGDFVRRAREYVDTGKLEEEEINYKLVIGERLGLAREAVLHNDADWPALLKRGLVGNLIFNITQAKLRDWIKKSPEDASEALEAIWAENDSSAADRIRAFGALLPSSEISGTGTRTTVASVLLMGLDVEQFPPFGTMIFGIAYDRTGYNEPEADADEAALYEHALGFLDRFIREAAQRGLTLRHRLDAQSVVWAVVRGRGDEPDLPALAEEVFLPVDFLQEIEKLLEEKKQVIFQGPPGTGKTFVAQKLAKCLAGSKDRVTLVQFHPSYAYEDFVQGFRPVAAGDGQVGFELRDGPLLRAAEAAENEPGARHFLVIDEINRGNLAKVFGELYFLLEYRDEEISLQYQQATDKKFSLPSNLFIIGTMNTADRSIALVDLALRRRFYFVEFHPDDEPVKSVLYKWLSAKAPGMEWVADVVENVNEKLEEDRHAAIGPSYFMKEGLDEKAVERIWEHSVTPYIEECLFGDSEKIGQFDLKKLMAETQAGDAPATEDGAERDSEPAGQDGDA